MTLADLIDLEAQLARDRDADPAALAARDRALVGPARPGELRRALLARWVAALREREPGAFHPGPAVANALRALRGLLVVAGLALGASAAAALLRYTGAEPVNVWDFLLVLVGLQIALLALLLLSFALPVASLGLPLVGLFRGLLAAVYPRLAARGLGLDPARLAGWRALWHRLRTRRSLYHQVEPWLLLSLTQGFGVAFNVGALLACLRAIVFSDLAFAWSTTLVELDPARFHALVRALAGPFGWLWPEAVPSRALVEATRWSRLEGAYLGAGAGRAVDAALAGAWWPFLVAALVCYGLLPRAVALVVSAGRAAWLRRTLPLDDVALQRVVHRLSEPDVQTRGAGEERTAGDGARPRAAVAAAPPGASGPCPAVLWRDVPRTPALEVALARRLACAAPAYHGAGGRDFAPAERDWAAALAGAPCAAVVAEGWEAPDRAAVRLVEDLRRALGARHRLTVLLVEVAGDAVRRPPPAQVATWEEALATLEDPYLSVEPLGDGAP